MSKRSMNPMNKVLLRFAAVVAMVVVSGPTWAQDAPEETGETPPAAMATEGEAAAPGSVVYASFGMVILQIVVVVTGAPVASSTG